MPVRKVIRIDEEKCDGCGQCVPSCAEGAIQVIDGKARLVSETYCDGLGACLGECPQDAIRMEERNADEFDPDAVAVHLSRLKAAGTGQGSGGHPLPVAHPPHACPGSLSQALAGNAAAAEFPGGASAAAPIPRLSNWPVQLHLAPVQAPYFDGADLLIAADCAPFAFADFHSRFIAGKRLLIGCPKLDDTSAYFEKLAQICSLNSVRSIEIAYMEVPCCFGLVTLVRQAAAASGREIPVSMVKLGIRGEILQRQEAAPQTPAHRQESLVSIGASGK